VYVVSHKVKVDARFIGMTKDVLYFHQEVSLNFIQTSMSYLSVTSQDLFCDLAANSVMVQVLDTHVTDLGV